MITAERHMLMMHFRICFEDQAWPSEERPYDHSPKGKENQTTEVARRIDPAYCKRSSQGM